MTESDRRAGRPAKWAERLSCNQTLSGLGTNHTTHDHPGLLSGSEGERWA
jgi:hypothetical protein